MRFLSQFCIDLVLNLFSYFDRLFIMKQLYEIDANESPIVVCTWQCILSANENILFLNANDNVHHHYVWRRAVLLRISFFLMVSWVFLWSICSEVNLNVTRIRVETETRFNNIITWLWIKIIPKYKYFCLCLYLKHISMD